MRQRTRSSRVPDQKDVRTFYGFLKMANPLAAQLQSMCWFNWPSADCRVLAESADRTVEGNDREVPLRLIHGNRQLPTNTRHSTNQLKTADLIKTRRSPSLGSLISTCSLALPDHLHRCL